MCELTATERRILLAALKEFQPTFENDFGDLRRYHPFLRKEDGAVDLAVLAAKLGVKLDEGRSLRSRQHN